MCICETCGNLDKKIKIEGFYKCKISKNKNQISLLKVRGNSTKYNWIYCSSYKEVIKQLELEF